VSRRVSAWIAACRPKTLAAGAVPVAVGSAYAYHQGVFAPLPAAAALLGALLIQVGTNLANDYYDHVKGADTPQRLGRPRATASGLIPGHRVRNAAYGTFAGAAFVGAYLTWHAGWPVVVIGTAGIVFGILYTAGPRPLGYVGMGDLLVFVFFGLVAVAGTHYVQALAFDPVAVALGVPVGALATAILAVNNYRDLGTDRAAGKRTLAVLAGAHATRVEYACLHALAYASVVAVAWSQGWRPSILLPLLAAPLAILNVRDLWTRSSPDDLNRLLEATARHLALFGVLLALGYLL
jgi:1,4-dihydroxy-2-naphthoate octaprenyltransferase